MPPTKKTADDPWNIAKIQTVSAFSQQSYCIIIFVIDLPAFLIKCLSLHALATNTGPITINIHNIGRHYKGKSNIGT